MPDASFFLAGLITGSCAFVADILWTKYIMSAAKKAALQAATWSAAILGVGAISTRLLVEDLRVLPFTLVGGFLGTYFAVRRAAKEEQRSSARPDDPSREVSL